MKKVVILFLMGLFLGGVAMGCSKKKGCNSCPDWGKVSTKQTEQA